MSLPKENHLHGLASELIAAFHVEGRLVLCSEQTTQTTSCLLNAFYVLFLFVVVSKLFYSHIAKRTMQTLNKHKFLLLMHISLYIELATPSPVHIP